MCTISLRIHSPNYLCEQSWLNAVKLLIKVVILMAMQVQLSNILQL